MTAVRLPEVPSHLLSAIYESAASPERWPDTVEQMTRWGGGVLGSFQVRRMGDHPSVMLVSTGTDPDCLRVYIERLHRVDPHLAQLANLPVGRALLSREVIPDNELVRTEFYDGFCRPQRIRDLQGVVLIKNSLWAASLAMFAPDHREFDEHTQRHLDALAPHVTRALILSFHFHERLPDEPVLQTVASMRVAGWVRVDASLAVVESNRAQALYAGTHALVIERGVLRAPCSDDQAKLTAAVRLATQGGATALSLGRGPGALQVGVTPGPRLSPFEVERCVSILFAPASAALSANDNDRLLELPASLGPVAEQLARGLSDKEIANALDMPIATVRTYVARVLKRLGLHSRRELMRDHRPNE